MNSHQFCAGTFSAFLPALFVVVLFAISTLITNISFSTRSHKIIDVTSLTSWWIFAWNWFTRYILSVISLFRCNSWSTIAMKIFFTYSARNGSIWTCQHIRVSITSFTSSNICKRLTWNTLSWVQHEHIRVHIELLWNIIFG